MNIFDQLAERDLDLIIAEEYGEEMSNPLFEKSGDDDSELTTPLKRLVSFPFRAIRYKKAKRVMLRYSRKILGRTEKIIRRFESELEKSIFEITKKGEDLQYQLNKAKNSNDENEIKSVINQQKRFKIEVDKNQEQRVQNLNQSIDNLISSYTQGITKRIDEPGYILQVELSEKGKADLKFLWEEYVALIKQQTYEKLIKIINNKHVKGLEKMISRLEVEIEEAEDRRYQSRRKRQEIANEEKRDFTEKMEKPETEFEKLVVYLNDELSKIGDGIEDEYKVAIDEEGELKIYDITFSIDHDDEIIEVNYYEEEGETVIRTSEIKNNLDVDHIIDDIEATSKIEASDQEERYEEKLVKSLSSKLELNLKNPSKDVQKKLGEELVNSYKNNPIEFTKKMVGLMLKDSDIYKEKIKAIERGISNPSLIDLLIQLRKDLIERVKVKFDPSKELSKYENIFINFEQTLNDIIKEKNITNKDRLVSDIILSGSLNILPSIEKFLDMPGISKDKKTKALSNMKTIIKLINYSSIKEPKGKTADTINKIINILGSEGVKNILNESFISFEKYKR